MENTNFSIQPEIKKTVNKLAVQQFILKLTELEAGLPKVIRFSDSNLSESLLCKSGRNHSPSPNIIEKSQYCKTNTEGVIQYESYCILYCDPNLLTWLRSLSSSAVSIADCLLAGRPDRFFILKFLYWSLYKNILYYINNIIL